jgi:hypothetical protein
LENYEKKYSNKSLKRNGYCCYGGKWNLLKPDKFVVLNIL